MTFASFWPRYLRAHARRRLRALHHAAIVLGLFAAGPALAFGGPWWAGPAGAVLLALAGHAVLARAAPPLLTHPLWATVAGARLFLRWLAGRRHVAAPAAKARDGGG